MSENVVDKFVELTDLPKSYFDEEVVGQAREYAADKRGFEIIENNWTKEGKILAALVKKLGGKAELSKNEIESVIGVEINDGDDLVTIEAD